MASVEIKDVSFSYKNSKEKKQILSCVNATFEEGTFNCILGESGSGKTTILNCLAGMEEVDEGSIEICGKQMNLKHAEELRRTVISMIFQSYNLIPYMSAVENVLTAMDISENVEQSDRRIAIQLLHNLGMEGKKIDRKVTMLSGGEQQRVAIARAIASQTKVILADEPTGNLDRKTADVIVELLIMLAHEYNKCVLVVTHDSKVAALADTCFIMDSEIKQLVRTK